MITIRLTILKLTLIAVALLNATFLIAQWRYAPITQHAGNLKMIGNGIGYGIKVNTLIKTTNSGTNWQSLNLNHSSENVIDFSISTNGIGYAINNNGELTKTIDGGTTWCKMVYLGGSLHKVQFVNDTVGFVINANGGFYKTTDGGFSWMHKIVNGSSFTYDMQFENTENGWLIGGGILHKTIDGGTTWTQQNLNGSFVQFIGNTGWAFSNNSMFKTTNGGSTWDSTFIGSQSVYKVQFISLTTGWRLTNLGFEITTNGGSTWSVGLGSPLQIAFESFAFSSTTHGIATDNRGNYYQTINGGVTWAVSNYGASTIPSVNTYDVFAANTNTAFMVNNAGGCLRTINKGLTWTPINTNTTSLLVAVHFSNDAKTGAIVGQSGVINTTNDSGVTWTTRTIGATTFYYDIIYANQTYFAIGSAGTIRKGNHAQTSWTSVTSGSTQVLRSVSFPSSQIGYIVGHGGVILKTTDGGTTWQSQSSGTTQNLIKVVFKNDTEGMAVGTTGTVLYTTNGGSTWSALATNTTEHFLSIANINNNQWWITGNNGNVYIKNGASPITFVQSLSSNPLNDIDFFDSNNGIIVANTGFILAYKMDCNNHLPVSYNTATNQTVCVGDSAVLKVGGKGKLKWYNTANATSVIGIGQSFVTPTLNTNTTFYVEDSSCQISTRLPIEVTVQSTIPTISTENFFTSCKEGAVNLGAITNGEKLNWYNQNSMLVAQGALFSTPYLSYGQYQYSVQAVLGACKSNLENITVNVEQQPEILAVNHDTVCGSGVLTISVGKNFGTSYWYGDSNYSIFIGQGFDTLTTPLLSQTKTYYVKVSGSRCVSPLTPVNAQVNSFPSTAIVLSKNKLTATQDSATYKWLNCDANLSWITTENAKEFLPSNSGNYAVEINLKGCIDTSICTNIVVDKTGVNELNAGFVTIYPNPATSRLMVSLDNFLKTNVHLTITDVTGKLVLKQQITNKNSQIDLSGFANGMYMLSITGADVLVSRKLQIIK